VVSLFSNDNLLSRPQKGEITVQGYK